MNLPLRSWLSRRFTHHRTRMATAGTATFILYTGLCAFLVYSCMYGFRRPFSAADYVAFNFNDLSYKVLAVCAQSFGYVLSKFIGIGVIGGLHKQGRPRIILTLILAGWTALLLFALVPPPFNLVFMLLNGLPLGLVWGVVFSYLEGRMTSEILGAMLCTSLILASGFARFVGKVLLVDFGVSEVWMPFAAGAVFLVPMIVCTFLLDAVPPPSNEDEHRRHPRPPMTHAERVGFLRVFGGALLPAIVTYVLLTVLRDVRDNFANEIWTESGYGAVPSVFATSEIGVAVLLLAAVAVAFSWKIKDNWHAFVGAHWLIVLGLLATGGVTILFLQGTISAFCWMVASGASLYTAYVLFICLYFERLLAAFQTRGNTGFLFYVADSCGYCAAMAVIITKEFFSISAHWTSFLSFACIGTATGGTGLVLLSLWQFRRLHRKEIGA